MQGTDVIERLWLGEIESREIDDMSPLSRMMCCLMDRPVVGLVALDGLTEPKAILEFEEVMPGTTFADILDEELGLDLEPDTLVVIEPADFASAESYAAKDLGNMLGQMMLDLFNTTAAEDIAALGQSMASHELEALNVCAKTVSGTQSADNLRNKDQERARAIHV